MLNKIKYFAWVPFIGVSAMAEGVDPAFTTAATELSEKLEAYIQAILPVLTGALGTLLAVVAIWAVFRVVRSVLGSAG